MTAGVADEGLDPSLRGSHPASHEHAPTSPRRPALALAPALAAQSQLFIKAYAKALEVIPRQLCNNAGFDATDVLNQLRQKHALPDDSGRVSAQCCHSSRLVPRVSLGVSGGCRGPPVAGRGAVILPRHRWTARRMLRACPPSQSYCPCAELRHGREHRRRMRHVRRLRVGARAGQDQRHPGAVLC
jgi:hypothetical protein